ncbi:phenoloxidase-activating factor 3-like isoform X2 [Portunus trituberculatus]|uniref:phenoloxidase-activating factor 3-like isoform X2 n=1 Tax=Portunus trituberculatus TaxID=210409 RepID=UPI001E1D044E|nr:phenoloxidase-activating factor 3-like isoform X2 [Portunus trituberculatus]
MRQLRNQSLFGSHCEEKDSSSSGVSTSFSWFKASGSPALVNMGPREVVQVMGVLVVIALTPATSTDIIFPDEVCIDGDPRCPALAVVGYCSSNSVYMSRVCRHSCSLCVTAEDSKAGSQPYEDRGEVVLTSTLPPEITTKPRRSIVNPDFECGGLPSPVLTRSRSQGATQDLQQENSGFAFEPSKTNGTQPIEHNSCGASVISDRFIVTSAYCVINRNITMVRLGDIDLARDNETNSNPSDYGVIDVILPPEFTEGVLYNDIALLKTDRKIEFNDAVFPYCVSSSPPPVGTEVIVAGFGFINETHKSTHLMEATLGVLPLAECEQKYLDKEGERLKKAYPSLLQERSGLLCAGDKKSGVCRGDEGGPLFRQREDGSRYLEGLISFTGSFCGDGVLPGIFTAIADYVDFIDDAIYGTENP